MDWTQLWLLLVSGTLGYLLGVTRDRLAVIRAKQVEAIQSLHARVVEIADKELFDGDGMRLAIVLQGDKTNNGISPEQVKYDAKLSQWRSRLREEEDRARLWIDMQAVDMVSAYFLLIMRCANWKRFGQGNLLEDERFLNYMRCVFGRSTNTTLRDVIIRHSATGKPRCLNLIRLSHQCLIAIQRRVRLEVESPFRFRLLQWMEKWSGETRKRRKWKV